eukprot:TRINITY_DN76129_c0_g1_i1.p1 TRINITY_DN76129_c0_g1~~TRINITY_DN76129_c0_g1_i1.p1  ORF type:complete len:413 (+),score=61.03 TRINITY_DN76129_c0_g1_i1:51-1289(+)
MALFTPEEQSELNKLKVELKIENERYLRAHPEVSVVLSTLVETILQEKPERQNILPFIEDFFISEDLQAIVDQREKTMEAERNSEPLTAKGLTKLADTMMQQQEWKKAVELYTKALAAAPNEPEVYYKRGFIYHKHLHQFQKAHADYSKAIEIKPIHSQAYRNRGDIVQYINHDPQTALEDYDLAVAFGLEDGDLYGSRGDAKRKTGDHTGAEVDLGMAASLSPNNALVKKYYGQFLHHVKLDYRRAAEEYTLALSLGLTSDPETLVGRADVYFKLKEYVNAEKDLEAALAKEPDREDAKTLLPQVQQQHLADEKAKAARLWSQNKQGLADIAFDGDLLKPESNDTVQILADIVNKFQVVTLVVTCVARQQEIATIRAESVQTALQMYIKDGERLTVSGKQGDASNVVVEFH